MTPPAEAWLAYIVEKYAGRGIKATEMLSELGRSAHMREVICRLAADSRPYRGGTHPSSVARTRHLFRSS